MTDPAWDWRECWRHYDYAGPGMPVEPRQRQPLVEDQLEYALRIGWARRSFARGVGLEQIYARSSVTRDPKADAVGAIGEYAFACWAGCPWHPVVGDLDKQVGDVEGWEVRTAQRPDGDLYIRGKDRDEQFVVLVTGPPPVLVIRGTILVAVARAHREWFVPANEHWAASYRVPQSALTMRALDAWRADDAE